MRIVVIANPASSRGGGLKGRQRLVDALDRAVSAETDCSYSIVETTTRGVAVRTGKFVEGSGAALAHQAALEGADVVAAAGGDGTVGEVANGLIGTETAMAVLPMGTGNDFARTLGIGTDLDLAARTLVSGDCQLIDVGRVVHGGNFVNVAGCGFDAEVAARINHGFRRLRGTSAYIAAVLQTLVSFHPAAIELEVDGVRHNAKVMLCAIANAKTYGGGMRIAPGAQLDDGLFDLVLVGDASKTEFLRAFPSVFKGTHITHPKVTIFRAKSIAIRSASPLPTLADGEEIGTTPVEFEIVPKALTVMVPRKSSIG